MVIPYLCEIPQSVSPLTTLCVAVVVAAGFVAVVVELAAEPFLTINFWFG